ncbi:MAG: pyruvate formate lyase-activating protein [Clostridia bacterium]|nr:pyruvate formate lyase-activating protein [Clostridia bacterium]
MSKVGKVHSFQSLGAVDGPGIRFVVFMQGCPYSCPYCHNPDTRPFSGGTEYKVEEIVAKAERYKTYFGEKGGVTVSGGEPLMQAEFVAELFEALHEKGITTALDTAGVKVTDAVRRVLASTDTVLCDIKFPTDELYKKHIGTGIDTVLDFIAECNKTQADVIVRHVVVPGMTDGEESVKTVASLAGAAKNLRGIELLPFKKLCVQKYDELGLEFPLADTPECDSDTIERLKKLI